MSKILVFNRFILENKVKKAVFEFEKSSVNLVSLLPKMSRFQISNTIFCRIELNYIKLIISIKEIKEIIEEIN